VLFIVQYMPFCRFKSDFKNEAVLHFFEAEANFDEFSFTICSQFVYNLFTIWLAASFF
jgi:hypothetical protein